MEWTPAGEYQDIRYELSGDGIAKITIDRPEVRNAFRPETVIELIGRVRAGAGGHLRRGDHPHRRGRAGVLLGRGPARARRVGLQSRRRRGGRALPRHRPPRADPPAAEAGRGDGRRLRGRRRARAARRLRPHDRRRQRALRADRPESRLVGRRLRRPRVLRDLVGTKKAKEIWLLCRQYDAQQALEMGLVNAVVPLERLEEETVAWCREMLALSPFALRLVKSSFNAAGGRLRRHPAARARHRTSCSTAARRRRRAGPPSSRSARPTSRSSRGARDARAATHRRACASG